MSLQAGRDVLIKISDGASPQSYETLAGIRAKTIALGANAVDATHTESSDGWRELIGGAGIKSARVSGSGVFKDAASDARMREVFFAQETPSWQLILPDFGTLEGAFLVTALSWGGDHDGEATFSLTLESAGALSFSAHVGGA